MCQGKGRGLEAPDPERSPRVRACLQGRLSAQAEDPAAACSKPTAPPPYCIVILCEQGMQNGSPRVLQLRAALWPGGHFVFISPVYEMRTGRCISSVAGHVLWTAMKRFVWPGIWASI